MCLHCWTGNQIEDDGIKAIAEALKVFEGSFIELNLASSYPSLPHFLALNHHATAAKKFRAVFGMMGGRAAGHTHPSYSPPATQTLVGLGVGRYFLRRCKGARRGGADAQCITGHPHPWMGRMYIANQCYEARRHYRVGPQEYRNGPCRSNHFGRGPQGKLRTVQVATTTDSPIVAWTL
eukprot:1194026-Prorocentrum_minimum.AAC.1